MLKSITKKYADDSDMKQFRFTFYCDCCGKGIKATPLAFQSVFSQKTFLTTSEREARAIIYANEHDKAYERANNEVRLELNRCEVCGAVICDDCSHYLDALGGGICCSRCAGQIQETGKVSSGEHVEKPTRKSGIVRLFDFLF